MHCDQCRKPLDVSVEFCDACGAKVGGASTRDLAEEQRAIRALSVASLVSGLMTFPGIIPAGIVGLATGGFALSRASNRGITAPGLAVAGVALSAFWMFVGFGLLMYVGDRINTEVSQLKRELQRWESGPPSDMWPIPPPPRWHNHRLLPQGTITEALRSIVDGRSGLKQTLSETEHGRQWLRHMLDVWGQVPSWNPLADLSSGGTGPRR